MPNHSSLSFNQLKQFTDLGDGTTFEILEDCGVGGWVGGNSDIVVVDGVTEDFSF